MFNDTIVPRWGPSLRLLALTLTLGLMGCGTSTQWDREIGAQVTEQVRKEMGVIDDPALNAYVNRVGQRLVTQLDDSPFTYRFTVLDQAEPNAFAVPGGDVFVTRGLLAVLNSEDELAGVLGHEIIHVEQRHAAKRYQRMTVPGVFALPGRTIGILAPRAGGLLASPFEGIDQRVTAAYSRDSERESDLLGQQLAANVGYDPMGLAVFLQQLDDVEVIVTGQSHEFSFTDSHPLTPERIETTTTRAQGMAWRPGRRIAPTPEAFYKLLDGLTLGPDPGEGILSGIQFIHADAGLTMNMPEGWFFMHTRNALGAYSPNEDALLFYDRPVRGADPEQAGQALAQELLAVGIVPQVQERLTINALQAYRLSADAGRMNRKNYTLDVVWWSHQGYILRQVSLSPEAMRPIARNTAMSLRTLSGSERRSVRIIKLRLVQARPGETLGQLCQRVPDLAWPIEAIGVLNALPIDHPLQTGQWIKVAHEEPYRPGEWRPDLR